MLECSKGACNVVDSFGGCRKKRDVAMRVATRMRHNLAASAWQSWRQSVDDSHAVRAADQHHCNVLMRESLACLFANAKKHRLLRRHVKGLQHRWQRSAWNAWAAAVQGMRERAALAQHLGDQNRSRRSLELQALCFVALCNWAKQRRDSRELLAQVRPARTRITYASYICDRGL